ncbi:MAG: hypothetical protein A2821_00985 [Candidatus Magasanikbacteria bacterium RIFCSPHIGHO2_01_FULL_41_23]|uniref:Uncharacterized protein n=1 Tax=Candidatus Magasanikbacteria bacterium RIFCSPLOWO2_01_FULL_40_15 TaxID=1798686 RepID=A0A1F6N1W3_9BACT|nr:MAG: hypothetical protein A2821_00985 [Candidatus Magasanikbacteria bacterium RIFCSPHIGHO2_01_FULL_41_23]OGH66663.1 MAG: hypothetical protein A3C66_01345 [Candidatus Magasanikbacteria bacterium RIFCSPHIGHO2_02_FULL_41_35]OGH74785.1 MAG: hypothetical protein A3F22_03725 [Candidatus Magasanikbacteria bacterium RIFCSPHIGHO2_12_FULL_41_16]OGH77919.1 MAG: hypothetical protein A2983_00345 [Candidatus Magasanikbacteria bacterium RIFCSPLOWO2_01_FULL_40_15]
MSTKKRRKTHNQSPFSAEIVAAMTKELPNVLIKEGYFRAEEKKPENTESKITPEKSYTKPQTMPVAVPITEPKNLHQIIPRGDRKALWYTVIFFSIFIFGIWLFNTKTVINTIWGEHSSQALINQGKNDLNSILETVKQNDKIFQKKLNDSSKIKSPIKTENSVNVEDSTKVENALKEALKSINQSSR